MADFPIFYYTKASKTSKEDQQSLRQPQDILGPWRIFFYRLFGKINKKKILISEAYSDAYTCYTDAKDHEVEHAVPAGLIVGNLGTVIGALVITTLIASGILIGGWAPLILLGAYFTFLGAGQLIFRGLKRLGLFPPDKLQHRNREQQVVSVLYGISGAIIGIAFAPWFALPAIIVAPVIAMLFAISAGLWARGRRHIDADYPEVGNKKQLLKNASAPSGIVGTLLGVCLGKFVVAACIASGVAAFLVIPIIGISALLGCMIGARLGYTTTAGKTPFFQNQRQLTGKQRVASIIFGLAAVRVAEAMIPAMLTLLGVTSALLATGIILGVAGLCFFLGYRIGHIVASKAFGEHFENGDARLIASIASVGAAAVLSSAAVFSATLIGAGSAIAFLPFLAIPLILTGLTYLICKIYKVHVNSKFAQEACLDHSKNLDENAKQILMEYQPPESPKKPEPCSTETIENNLGMVDEKNQGKEPPPPSLSGFNESKSTAKPASDSISHLCPTPGGSTNHSVENK